LFFLHQSEQALTTTVKQLATTHLYFQERSSSYFQSPRRKEMGSAASIDTATQSAQSDKPGTIVASDVANQYFENNLSKEDLINSLLPLYLKESHKFDEIYQILKSRASLEMKRNSMSVSASGSGMNDITTPQSITTEIVNALNLLRLTPKEFIPLLKEHLSSFVDDVHYIENRDTNIRIRTREGVAAVHECISYLQSIEPRVGITGNQLLENSALDQVKDLSAHDKLSHVSVDGSSIQHRIERYGTWRGFIGENIDCGNRSAMMIVMMLLIDDGDPSRGHRENCLNPNFLEVGAAIASHPSYQCCCVMDFATRVIPWSDVQTTSITVESNSKKEISEQTEAFQRVVRSIPMDNVTEQIYDMLEIEDSQVSIEYQPEKSSAVIQCKTGKTIRKLNVTWESK
jgi:uncharacterized protein YkwD